MPASLNVLVPAFRDDSPGAGFDDMKPGLMEVAMIASQSPSNPGRRFAGSDRITRQLLGMDGRTAGSRDQDERQSSKGRCHTPRLATNAGILSSLVPLCRDERGAGFGGSATVAHGAKRLAARECPERRSAASRPEDALFRRLGASLRGRSAPGASRAARRQVFGSSAFDLDEGRDRTDQSVSGWTHEPANVILKEWSPERRSSRSSRASRNRAPSLRQSPRKPGRSMTGMAENILRESKSAGRGRFRTTNNAVGSVPCSSRAGPNT